eukprot:357715-Chlamydomonas_euryale.AAC.6
MAAAAGAPGLPFQTLPRVPHNRAWACASFTPPPLLCLSAHLSPRGACVHAWPLPRIPTGCFRTGPLPPPLAAAARTHFVHHAVCALADAVDLLKLIHVAALAQHIVHLACGRGRRRALRLGVLRVGLARAARPQSRAGYRAAVAFHTATAAAAFVVLGSAVLALVAAARHRRRRLERHGRIGVDTLVVAAIGTPKPRRLERSNIVHRAVQQAATAAEARRLAASAAAGAGPAGRLGRCGRGAIVAALALAAVAVHVASATFLVPVAPNYLSGLEVAALAAIGGLAAGRRGCRWRRACALLVPPHEGLPCSPQLR